MSNLVFDVAILVILLFFVFGGMRRGLILSLCGMLAVFVAFGGAVYAAKALTPTVADLIEPRITTLLEDRIDEKLAEKLQDGVAITDIDDSALLQYVTDVLQDLGLYDNVSDAINSAVATNAADVAASVAAAVSASLSESLAYLLLFLVIFVVMLLLWTLVSHVLDLACRLPVLHTLNRLGGALFGLAKGALLLFILVWLLRKLGVNPSDDVLSQSYLLPFFWKTDPVALLLSVTR